MAPSPLVLRQFQVSYGAGRLNLRGLSDVEALRTPDAGGSAVNWIAGHIVHLRERVHALLGIPAVEGHERLAVYGRGSRSLAAEDAVPLRAIVGLWKASQRGITDLATSRSTDDWWARFAAPLDEPNERIGDTVGSAVAFLAFHEAYHVGQIGISRRLLGLEGAIP